MENEIDDDELAAMLAEAEQEEEEAKKNEPSTADLSFVEQADTMTPVQLIELTYSLIDKPTLTKKSPTYKFSDTDMGELFGSKTSKYDEKLVDDERNIPQRIGNNSIHRSYLHPTPVISLN
jgi:hypothetical protein